jgi:hypothetical protein
VTLEANLPNTNTNKDNDDNVEPNPEINPSQNQTIDSSIDPLQGIDWSMIIDDFGWIGEGPIFLGPA